jgi:8-oxo-dGTP pyrophosphatase MutT (NUDIX family)
MGMRFCPNCGSELKEVLLDKKVIKECSCGFIDWDNWVNVSTVVVCYTNNNEFIMVRLKGNEKGKITFPGGYRDLGETLEEAAKREFFEETGCEIDNLKLFKVYNRDDIRLIWVVFTANLCGGQFIENSETEAILLFSFNNLPNIQDLRGELTKKLLNDVIMDKSTNEKKYL